MKLNVPDGLMVALEQELKGDKALLAAQGMGWQQLESGVYFHQGKGDVPIVHVVGLAYANMVDLNVVWLV